MLIVWDAYAHSRTHANTFTYAHSYKTCILAYASPAQIKIVCIYHILRYIYIYIYIYIHLSSIRKSPFIPFQIILDNHIPCSSPTSTINRQLPHASPSFIFHL